MNYRYLKNQIYRISFFILVCGLCSSYIAISEEDREENIQYKIKVFEDKYYNTTDQKEKLELLFKICENYQYIPTDKFLLYSNEAYVLAKKLKDVDKQLQALKMIEYNYYLVGNYSQSVETLLEAYDIAINHKRKKESIDIKFRLGDNYRALTNSQKAISIINDGLKEANEIKDTLLIARGYNRLSATYFEYIQDGPQNILDSTQYYAVQSLELARKINDTALIINNLNILGATYIDIKKQNYDQAKSTLMEALQLADLIDDKESSTLISYHLSKLYHLENNLDSVFYYANYGYSTAKESNINNLISLLAHSLSTYYEKVGQYDSSLKYFQEFHKYFEIVNNNRQGFKIQMLIDENNKKQENLKAELRAQSERLQTIIYVLVMLLLGFVSVVLYFRHKRSEKSRYLLQTQFNTIESQNQELEKKNEIISDQNIKLEKSNQSKDQLFSMISHDLKNPIGNLDSSISLLLDNWEIFEESDRKELLSDLEKSNKNVLLLLFDLLDWAKSQQGMIKAQCFEQDINFIIKQNIEFIHKTANDKGIQLIMDLQENAIGYFDTPMINTVIRNLLTNAIKFTNRGGKITISSKNADDKLIVSVADTGIGISEENLAKITTEGQSITTMGTEGEKGTGFGIKLINDFLNKNNSQLFIESQVGVGTKFTFTLPVGAENEL